MFVSFKEIVYLCRKIRMKDDILESVSQRGSGEEKVLQIFTKNVMGKVTQFQ